MKLEEHIFQSASLIALIGEAVDFMISTPMVSVPPEERISGGGVYSLYYKGDFPLYQKLFEENLELPIYVGKAVLPG